MSSRETDEFRNPVAALDRLPRYRCVLMGLAAGVSSVAAAFAGVIVLYGTLVARPNADLWVSPAFGGGLLIVALFMVLVW